ncbi:MAG TPA: DUF4230 domain-containing protein [Gemmatimonadales bacterium]|nr:DUF4230 domain-containing protein [Gemmatimonadales bacterium]
MNQPSARSGSPGLGWIGLVLLGLLAIGVIYTLRLTGSVGRLFTGRTSITHDVALGRMESVGKLITSETGLRDVVTYRNTRLGSTKKSLVVVTGRALAGIDLKDRTKVEIDAPQKRITLTVPHARILSVEVATLKTYDEDSGLWNWFRPADRDTIFLLARAQLMHAANDLAVIDHAEESAKKLFAALFAPEGYAVDVVFVPFLSTDGH